MTIIIILLPEALSTSVILKFQPVILLKYSAARVELLIVLTCMT